MHLNVRGEHIHERHNNDIELNDIVLLVLCIPARRSINVMTVSSSR